MGLDDVELVMAAEDEFDIAIPDDKAAKIRTVRDFVDLVYTKVSERSAEDLHNCYTEKIDQKFVKVVNCSISDLPPETRVQTLLTPGKEIQQWSQLQLQPFVTGLPTPIIAGLFSLLSFSGVLLAAFQFNLSPSVLVAVTIPAALMTCVASRPFRKIPDNNLTVGDLLWWANDTPHDSISRSDIFEKLKNIIVDQLGVTEDEVTEDARFVEDLGIG